MFRFSSYNILQLCTEILQELRKFREVKKDQSSYKARFEPSYILFGTQEPQPLHHRCCRCCQSLFYPFHRQTLETNTVRNYRTCIRNLSILHCAFLANVHLCNIKATESEMGHHGSTPKHLVWATSSAAA